LPCIERLTPQVVTVQLDQIEGVEEHAGVVPPIADAVEARHAIALAGDCLAVDDAGVRAQTGECLDNQWEAVGEIVAGAAVEPHAVAILASDDPEPVMLDFVQPRLARWRLQGFGRQAGRDETVRQGHLLPISRRTRQSTRGDSLAVKTASSICL